MAIGSQLDVLAFAGLTAVLWGFTPILSKRGMAAGGSSLQAALVVVTVDSAIYWTLLAIFRGPGDLFAGIPLDIIGWFLLAGLVGTALGRLFTFAGVHRVGASVNSAGISTRPLFASILAVVFLGEVLTPVLALGIVVLVVGVVVLSTAKGGDLGGWRPIELLFPLGGAAAFAAGNVIRRFGLTASDITPLEAVTLNETAGLVALLAYALATRRIDVLRAPRRTYYFFAGSGTLTGIALLSLFEALQRGQVVIVDPLVGTAPLFTTVFAYLLLGDLERVTKGIVVGAALIVLGAAIISVLG